MAKEQRNKELEIRIAEQKVTLDQLLLLLGHYESSPKMRTLRENLTDLDKIYAKIDVKYIKGESKEVIENGILTIQQTEIPEITMTTQDLDNIYAKIVEIRNSIIN